ncbi:MAG: NnrS family protein [Burkholderiaceae bacterium]
MTERGIALWQLGFRPFYLLAAIFAVLSVGTWAAQFAGHLPYAGHAGPYWHAHETIFGYTFAVIAGFLFTIVHSWTNRPTPTGALLAMIVGLWLLARVLVFTPWSGALAAANLAFALAATAGIGIPLWQARNRRNYVFIGLMLLISAALALFHLSELDVIALPSWAGVQLGMDVVLLMIAAVAGRVVPIYTNKAVPGAHARRSQNIERLAMGGLAVLLAADLLQASGPVLAVLLIALALVHGWRLFLWDIRSALRVPLLWVLYIAYAWIPAHLVLRAMAEPGWVAQALAIHAFTIGAIGGLTMAMMIRTARAHTGRALTADRYDVASCALLAAAAALRVFWPLVQPQHHVQAMLGSAVLWSAAFVLFIARHGPALVRPRLDGRPT